MVLSGASLCNVLGQRRGDDKAGGCTRKSNASCSRDGAAGREGTALQMSGSIADQLSKPFRLSEEERKVLSHQIAEPDQTGDEHKSAR